MCVVCSRNGTTKRRLVTYRFADCRNCVAGRCPSSSVSVRPVIIHQFNRNSKRNCIHTYLNVIVVELVYLFITSSWLWGYRHMQWLMHWHIVPLWLLHLYSIFVSNNTPPVRLKTLNMTNWHQFNHFNCSPVNQRRCHGSTDDIKAVHTNVPVWVRIYCLLSTSRRERALDLNKYKFRLSHFRSLLVILTSSFVVWSLVVKYVWKPANPMTDQIEKKQIIVTTTLNGDCRTTSTNSSSSPSLATVNIKILK